MTEICGNVCAASFRFVIIPHTNENYSSGSYRYLFHFESTSLRIRSIRKNSKMEYKRERRKVLNWSNALCPYISINKFKMVTGDHWEQQQQQQQQNKKNEDRKNIMLLRWVTVTNTNVHNNNIVCPSQCRLNLFSYVLCICFFFLFALYTFQSENWLAIEMRQENANKDLTINGQKREEANIESNIIRRLPVPRKRNDRNKYNIHLCQCHTNITV